MKKRILSLSMVLCLMLALLPGKAFAAMQIFVKTPSGQHLALNVEPTDRIEDVKAAAETATGIPAARQLLYYGGTLLEDGNTLQDYGIQKDSTLTLQDTGGGVPGYPSISAGTVICFAGYEWYALGAPDGNGRITLLAKNGDFGSSPFESDVGSEAGHTPSDYSKSDLKTYIEAIPKSKNFPAAETGLLSNLRALTAGEAGKLSAGILSFSGNWWLATPSTEDDYYLAAYVYSTGGIHTLGTYTYYSCAVRPAFDLDLGGVLFATSASAGGKSAAAAGGPLIPASVPGGSVKFTFQSDALTFTLAATAAQSVQSGGTLSFEAFASAGGSGVSCYLSNKDNAYYGNLAAGTGGSLSVPLSGVADGVYTLRLFTEQANGDACSDFCSAPVSMTVTVANGVGTVSDFGGTVQKDASVTPASAVYDKYSARAGLTFTLDPGSYTLTALKCGESVLTEGADYSVSGRDITVGQSWLDRQSTGGVPLTFAMSGGTAPAVTISISDSAPQAPVVTAGAGSSWTQGGAAGLEFTCDADPADSLRAEVDGRAVPDGGYTVKSGNAAVTLSPAWLETLTAGVHTLRIVSPAGTTAVQFTILAKETAAPSSSPRTGDDSGALLWLALTGLSLGAAVLLRRKRRV